MKQFQSTLPYILQYNKLEKILNNTNRNNVYQDRTIQIPQSLWNSSVFAFRIPFLYEQLTSPNLVSQTDVERLTEVLNQNTSLVINLGRLENLVYSLRYLFVPERGDIQIYLLVRYLGPSSITTETLTQLATDIGTVFASFNYTLTAVTSENDLLKLILPIQNPTIVELRQHEETVAMVHGDAYVVYPFRPHPNSWIALCRNLLQQSSPCLLSISLSATRLTYKEKELLTQAAQLAETLADIQYDGYIAKGRIVDPVARTVAQLYNEYCRKLVNPFKLLIQIAGEDSLSVRNVAQAFAAEITEVRSINEAIGGNAGLPSGYDLVTSFSEMGMDTTNNALSDIGFSQWGSSLASPGKERLFSLVDAQTAASAFRFPIAIHGGIPGILTRQMTPGYDVGPRASTVQDHEITMGEYSDRGGAANLQIANLNKHLLIAGTTGSGKTTTVMFLLDQMWHKGIPFLVIEPEKHEYRSLINSPIGKDLQVFTLGNDDVAPFRLNPLEILPGIRAETHITYLQECFESALPTFGILPSLLEESLNQVYLEKGWYLTKRRSVDNTLLMPILGELFFEIIRASEGRGYSEKTLQDIRAAATGRINSLLRGSKGRLLNTRQSVPLSRIMSKPTILELEDLNDEEKSLVMMFLLTAIREYCTTTRESDTLAHVTVIEEAHRVMANTPRTGNREIAGDSRAQSVGMFSNMLSEIRSLGEGVIIAEQIPSRLAEDALKNSSTKIIHRMPGKDDQEALASTMNLSQEQQSYLAKLRAGQAVVFTEGYEHPTFISVPNYKGDLKLPSRLLDTTVQRHMYATYLEQDDALLPFTGCRYCVRVCEYRDRIGLVAYDIEAHRSFQQAIWKYEQERQRGNATMGWRQIAGACRQSLDRVGLADDINAAYCYLTHLWQYAFTEAMARQFWDVMLES